MAKKHKGRGRLTAIDLLPEQCNELIAIAAKQLQERDLTQTEIYKEFFEGCQALQAEHHGELEFKIPSKSSFNRYSIKLALITRRLEETREIAGAISERFDAEASDDLTLIAAEAIKTLIWEVVTGAGEAGIDPKGAMALASALHKANQAQSVSSKRRKEVEENFADQVDETIDKLQTEAGLSAERAADLRNQLLGVRK